MPLSSCSTLPPSLPPSLPLSFLPSFPPPLSGINWFGKRKLVIFEDVEGNYIEITSIFTFGFLRTTQSIITEMDQEVFRQDGYHHW